MVPGEQGGKIPFEKPPSLRVYLGHPDWKVLFAPCPNPGSQWVPNISFQSLPCFLESLHGIGFPVGFFSRTLFLDVYPLMWVWYFPAAPLSLKSLIFKALCHTSGVRWKNEWLLTLVGWKWMDCKIVPLPSFIDFLCLFKRPPLDVNTSFRSHCNGSSRVCFPRRLIWTVGNESQLSPWRLTVHVETEASFSK